MNKTLRVLMVDDSADDAILLLEVLRAGGYETVHALVDSAAAMRKALQRQPWDVITCDHAMPHFSAVAALELSRQLRPDLPFIIVSGEIDLDLAVSLMKEGAKDYVPKQDLPRVLPAIERELREAEIRRERREAWDAREVSEARYRRLFETAQDGILILNAETAQIEDVNPYLIQMLGYSHAEFLGKKLWEVGAFADTPQSKEMFLQLQEKGYVRYEDLPLRTKAGTPVDVEFVSNSYDCEGIKVIQCNIRNITDRKRVERELDARKLRYMAVANSAQDAIVGSDAAGRIVDWNPSAERLFGYSEAEVIGQPLSLLMPQRFQDPHRDGMKRVLSGGDRHAIGRTVELAGRRKDASEFPLELSLAMWETAEGRYFTGIIRDITKRKAAEAQIHRQVQLYAALSQCNKAIVRCTGEEDLFPEICRAAVQFGGMKMAWVGLVDSKTLMVRPAASFGDGTEDLHDIEIALDADSPLGRGPTGTAIRENEPFWCQNFWSDPKTAPWRERAERHGWSASASLPLHRNGAVIGAFILYSGEANCFDEMTRALLIEMATDISFALDNFARESRRKDAEEGLRAAEERFRGLVEQSIAGIYIIEDGRLTYVNPRCAEIIGQGPGSELLGTDPSLLVAAADRGTVADKLRSLLDGEAHSLALDFAILRKDGVTIQVGANAARVTRHGKPSIIGLLQDISEKKRAEEQIQRYIEQLRTAFMSTVEVATVMSEMRDPYTAGHERRVAAIAVAIGIELGLDERRQEGLRVAGHLHDIGKINIPSEILSKPGRLNAVEMQLIRGHVQAGYEILKGVQFPWPVAEVVLQHHERMDGSGYPQGLKSEAILIEARIIAVADVVEAMSSHRPYRPGLGIEAAMAEIELGRGIKYDAQAANACLRLFREKGFPFPE